jgi:hypothetical protein
MGWRFTFVVLEYAKNRGNILRCGSILGTCGGDWNDGGDSDSALPEIGGRGGQIIVIGMCNTNTLNTPEIEKGPGVSS